MQYRLAVIVLDFIKGEGLLDEIEYGNIRKTLAAEFDAPIGMFEAEDSLWEIEL